MYADTDNSPGESSTGETNKHIACDYAIFTHCSFDASRNNHNFYRIVDRMKKTKSYNRNNQLREKRNATFDR